MSEEKNTSVVPIIISVVSVLILAGGVYYLIDNKNTTCR